MQKESDSEMYNVIFHKTIYGVVNVNQLLALHFVVL